MACRKEVVIGVLLAAPLSLAGCAQQAPVESAATTTAPATQPATQPGAPAVDAAPAGAASSRVFIDPVTGEQRAPTAAESAAAAKARPAQPVGTAKARQKAPVEVIQVPGGFTEVRVGEGAMHEQMVCLQPDGSLTACAAKP